MNERYKWERGDSLSSIRDFLKDMGGAALSLFKLKEEG